MRPRTVGALVLRHLFLYIRNWVRPVELVFWPMMDLLVMGYLTLFLQQQTAGDFPLFIRFLIGAVILWDVLYRSEQAVAISLLEDVWTRNLLNVFAAPVRLSEYMGATFVLGMIRVSLTVAVLAGVAQALYAFDLLQFQWMLLPYLASLLIFGWALGMITTALILRWGQAAESLAWAIPFLIQPLAAVFYPLDVLPGWVQWIARALPCTYIFEGMRAVLQAGHGPSSDLAYALSLNLIWLALAAGFFMLMFRKAREKGLLTKMATQ